MIRTFEVVVTVCLLALAGCASPQPPASSRSQQPDDGKLPIVEACVDAEAKITRTQVVRSSGYPEIDAAAIKIANATRYSPAQDRSGANESESCVRFKVKFVLRDGEPELEDKPD